MNIVMKKLVMWEFVMFLLVLTTYLVAKNFLAQESAMIVVFGATSFTLLFAVIWELDAVILLPLFVAFVTSILSLVAYLYLLQGNNLPAIIAPFLIFIGIIPIVAVLGAKKLELEEFPVAVSFAIEVLAIHFLF